MQLITPTGLTFLISNQTLEILPTVVLTTPIVAFVVATAAALLKVNLRYPEFHYLIVSTFLLLGSGLKDGIELSEVSIGLFWRLLPAVLLLGLTNPLILFHYYD